MIFEREDGKKTKIGAQFHNIGKIAHLVRENALLLSAAAALNITSVMPAYNIIANSIQCYLAVDFDNSFGVFVHRIRKNPGRALLLSKLIRVADLGITDVDFEKKRRSGRIAGRTAKTVGKRNIGQFGPSRR